MGFDSAERQLNMLNGTVNCQPCTKDTANKKKGASKNRMLRLSGTLLQAHYILNVSCYMV